MLSNLGSFAKKVLSSGAYSIRLGLSRWKEKAHEFFKWNPPVRNRFSDWARVVIVVAGFMAIIKTISYLASLLWTFLSMVSSGWAFLLTAVGIGTVIFILETLPVEPAQEPAHQ